MTTLKGPMEYLSTKSCKSSENFGSAPNFVRIETAAHVGLEWSAGADDCHGRWLTGPTLEILSMAGMQARAARRDLQSQRVEEMIRSFVNQNSEWPVPMRPPRAPAPSAEQGSQLPGNGVYILQ